MSKPYRLHDDATIESLRRDPCFAEHYVDAIFRDGDPAEIALALWQSAEALQHCVTRELEPPAEMG